MSTGRSSCRRYATTRFRDHPAERGQVARPVDEISRLKLERQDCADFIEKYRSFIELGVQEWKKQYDALDGVKKLVLFVMTTGMKKVDCVVDFLQREYAFLNGAVLTIHTNRNSDVTGSGKKGGEELDALRKMFGTDTSERLVIVGTHPFLKFVETLKDEGIEFEYRPWATVRRPRGICVYRLTRTRMPTRPGCSR